MTEDHKNRIDENQQDLTRQKPVGRIPWWVSIVCAIGTYCTLKYILPELQPANETLQTLCDMGPTAAPVLTIPFLLLAAKQLYDDDQPKQSMNENDVEES